MISMDKCQQFKLFLKSEADRLNLSVNHVYSTFFLRLLLENISKRNVDGSIIVKGSFAQFVYLDKLVRPIVDLDLTSVVSSLEVLPVIMFSVSDHCEMDGLEYSLRRGIYQTPNGIYKIKVSANYGEIAHCISMDYRENHPCIYEMQVRNVPKLFSGDSEYDIVVPSLEETLAEKLCIIAESNKTNLYNTRIKDFYDFYQLMGGSYDFEKFSYYFEKMLGVRQKIRISDVSASHLNDEFINRHRIIWNNTERNMEFYEREIDFAELVYDVSGVLSEQSERIRKGKNKVYTCRDVRK